MFSEVSRCQECWQTTFPTARSIPLGSEDCQPPSLNTNEKSAENFSFNHGVEGSSPSALTMFIALSSASIFFAHAVESFLTQ
jgi:hypothetical protein